MIRSQSRRLHLELSDAELQQRLDEWKRTPREPLAARGYTKLYIDHVNHADEGADLDFLVGKSGRYVPRESH